jgi:translation initiation factor 1
MTRLFAGTPFDRPPRCERCGALQTECKCPQPRIPPESQTARVSIEKRKKGKRVTVIRGLSQEGNDLSALLTQLKTACGAGGTLQSESLEIQGEHCDRVRGLLEQMGYRTK